MSAFAGRGKKTAWETWKAFPEVTEAFNELMQMPCDVSELSKSRKGVLSAASAKRLPSTTITVIQSFVLLFGRM